MAKIEQAIEYSGLIDTLLKGLKLGADEYKAFNKTGILEYLNTQIDKYSYVNTFLHRDKKVKFEDVYFPVKISDDKISTDFKQPRRFINKHKYIAITGIAGSGKSTFVKYVFMQTLQAAHKIPILFELRNVNQDKRNIEDIILEIISKRNIKPNLNIVKRALKSGQFLFILDGFDEIYSDCKNETIKSIDEFIDIYPENNYIITSRPHSGVETLNRFQHFKICPLNDSDIISFIKMMVLEEERRERILIKINAIKNSSLKSYFENPLLLSMFILVFENFPEIPDKTSGFYRNVFDTLYSKHDGVTKNSFERERITHLQREDFEEILKRFSAITYLQGEFSFDEITLHDSLLLIKQSLEKTDFSIENLIKDLTVSLSIIIKEGLEYKFPHRSMQEYFFASFISSQPEIKKKKIYTKLRKDISKCVENKHLLQLLEELDEIGLYNYYSKPILKKIKDKISKELDDTTRVLNFFSIFDVITVSAMENGTNIAYISNSLVGSLPPQYSYIIYGRKASDMFFLEGFKTEISELFDEDESFRSLDKVQESEKYVEIFLKYGIIDYLDTTIDEINEAIYKDEKKLKMQDDFIGLLLK